MTPPNGSGEKDDIKPGIKSEPESSDNSSSQSKAEKSKGKKSAKKKDETVSFIEKLTSQGTKELDKEMLNVLKQDCIRFGDDYVTKIFTITLSQLTKPHSQIRYAALLLLDYLFQKSHNARLLMLGEWEQLLLHALCLVVKEIGPDGPRFEVDKKYKLPPPKGWADDLKSKTLEIIEFWEREFGSGYEGLRNNVRYLRNSSHVDFRERAVRNEQEERRRRAREDEERVKMTIKQEKATKASEEFEEEIEPEMRTIITQIKSCLELIVPHLGLLGGEGDNENEPESFDDSALGTTDERSDEEGASGIKDDLRAHGIISKAHTVEITIKPQVDVKLTRENEPIIENLKELKHQLADIKLPKLKKLLKHMSPGSEFCEDQLKRAIDLKMEAVSLIDSLDEMKIMHEHESVDEDDLFGEFSGSDSSDSDDWEDVEEKEGLELIIPPERREEYGLPKEESTTSSDLYKPSTSQGPRAGSSSSSGRSCRVPLPNGRLCPRRDAIRCPFHGVIIDRDQNGVPINEKERIEWEKQQELERANRPPDWQDPALLREIKAATGIDLTMPAKGRRSTKRKASALEDIKKLQQTPRKRLQKKLRKYLNKKSRPRKKSFEVDLDPVDD